MIDCHAHLGEFRDKIDTVIEDAKKAGVVGVIVVPEYGKSMRSQIVVVMTRF
jgi:Tat protein secretion system quality control protein TatD with DNase activity